MGSQFVDFNADGHLDYISATFDGSPHVAYGSKDGFKEPVRLKDRSGRRIMISSIWNYDDEEHQTHYDSMPDGARRAERCISALAFDWDGDGDYDLLLGSYENGRLYRQMNEGSNAKPAFTGKNVEVHAGGKPIALSAKMTAPQLVDWDGDGDMDLVVGSFGDSYGHEGKGGAVYLAVNEGKPGKPEFAALETLVAPSKKGADRPTRPDAGLYPHVTDWDGDGDLDLIVGGYSMWTPKPKQLTADEETLVAKLKDEQKAARKKQSDLMQKISADTQKATEGLDRKSKEYRAASSKAFQKHSKEYTEISRSVQAVSKKLEKLVGGPKRTSFVWLYERL